MAVALVLVALILSGALVGSLWLVRPYVDRLTKVIELAAAHTPELINRLFPVKEGTGPVEPIPVDILTHINRLPQKHSRESEEAYFRELYEKLGSSWPNVRVATGLAGNVVDAE